MLNKMRGASLLLFTFSLSFSCISLSHHDRNELIAAVNKGDAAAVRRLIKGGANVNARGDDGETVLMNAVCCAKKNTEIAILLLDSGAEVNARTADSGLTPLMFAVQNGRPEFITLLLSRGAAVNAETANGSTALSLAEQFGRDEIARLLKEAGGVGIKTADLPLGSLGSLPQKYRETVLAVNRACVRGTLPPSGAEFLKVVGEGKPDLTPPLSLSDIPLAVLELVLEKKATAFTYLLDMWATVISTNADSRESSTIKFWTSPEGLALAEQWRRSRVGFIATLKRAVSIGKISQQRLELSLQRAGMATTAETDRSNADQAARQAAEPYFQRGSDAIQKRQFDKAVAEFNRCLELYDKWAIAYYWRGTAYLQKSQFDKAVTDADKAIELDPKLTLAYGLAGEASLRTGQYDHAIARLNKAVEMAPKWAEAYGLRGEAYLRKSQYDSAIADHTRALELNPKLAGAYYQRGYAYGMKGQFEKVVPDAEKAAALNPEYADAYRLKAIACERLKRTQEAIKAYRDFIKHAPPANKSLVEDAMKRIAELEKQ